MLDIGFLELMLIGVVALLVLGPERLPRAARTAGLWVGKIKRTISGMQREISAQLEAEELRQKLNEQQKKLDDSLTKAKRDMERITEAPARRAPSANAADGATNDAKADTQPDTAAKVAPETAAQAANASAHVDEALEQLRETPPETTSTPPSESSSHKESDPR
ncbi:Sec-independent protein translocase protein TatB [Halomonas dongshanensis]|uniref:Sec-independent protein translocase protein TatB n=1 Tax=Halomonas dongshanensis TaxID=2890835 RepID=A0ABT2EH96_9GAMM|nr:Sec-independent protein translocase protein TatB [Halomonas dongshanensis]MCS2610941.1 Sec-independent protein translocase protein TatB [Halomonas dongshanensis]